MLTQTRISRKSKIEKDVVIIGTLLFMFGLVLEYTQALVNRDSSWDDVILNSEGILIGSLVYCASRSNRRKATLLLTVALIVLIHSFKLPITYGVASYFLPEKPTIADFEGLGALVKILEVEGVKVELTSSPQTWTNNASTILQVDFESGDYPGFQILEPFKSWYRYKILAFSVFNPTSKPASLTIRIHDKHHNNDTQDRFNRSMTLDPGETKIAIPIDNIRYLGDDYSDRRQMDLRNIIGIILFMATPEPSIKLFFDDFRLE